MYKIFIYKYKILFIGFLYKTFKQYVYNNSKKRYSSSHCWKDVKYLVLGFSIYDVLIFFIFGVFLLHAHILIKLIAGVFSLVGFSNII